jgi:hypothetical protein
VKSPLPNPCLQTDRAPSGALHQRGTVWASHSVALGWDSEAGSRQLKHQSVSQQGQIRLHQELSRSPASRFAWLSLRSALPWSFARPFDQADVLFGGAHLETGSSRAPLCWAGRRRRLLPAKKSPSSRESPFGRRLAPRGIFERRLALRGRAPRRRQVRERADRSAGPLVGNRRRRLPSAGVAGAEEDPLCSHEALTCWLTRRCRLSARGL